MKIHLQSFKIKKMEITFLVNDVILSFPWRQRIIPCMLGWSWRGILSPSRTINTPIEMVEFSATYNQGYIFIYFRKVGNFHEFLGRVNVCKTLFQTFIEQECYKSMYVECIIKTQILYVKLMMFNYSKPENIMSPPPPEKQ